MSMEFDRLHKQINMFQLIQCNAYKNETDTFL